MGLCLLGETKALDLNTELWNDLDLEMPPSQ